MSTIFIIGILVLILHYTKILSPLENGVFKATSYVRGTFCNTSRFFGDYFYSTLHYGKIKQENENIKNQINTLVVDKSYIKTLENENNSLKKSLNYKNTNKKTMVTAKVMPGFYMETSSVLVLDKGKNSGIDLGMPVIYGDGIIVGKIVGVESEKSYALLLSDRNSVLTIFIQGDEKISGVLKGDLDYGLQLDYIPVESTIKENDIITTSGLESKIAKGYVVGQVKEVIFNEGDFFKRAIVEPSINYQALDFVNVITN